MRAQANRARAERRRQRRAGGTIACTRARKCTSKRDPPAHLVRGRGWEARGVCVRGGCDGPRFDRHPASRASVRRQERHAANEQTTRRAVRAEPAHHNHKPFPCAPITARSARPGPLARGSVWHPPRIRSALSPRGRWGDEAAPRPRAVAPGRPPSPRPNPPARPPRRPHPSPAVENSRRDPGPGPRACSDAPRRSSTRRMTNRPFLRPPPAPRSHPRRPRHPPRSQVSDPRPVVRDRER